MKTLPAALATLTALAALFLATPGTFACEENSCRYLPEMTVGAAAKPQTRALKKKPKKECEENFCK